MEILFILLPLGIILLGIGIWAFFWAVKNDQFEDMEGPAYSILFDEDDTANTTNNNNNNNESNSTSQSNDTVNTPTASDQDPK